MSFGAFVVIAVAPLMMRSCFCFLLLRLASQLRLRAVLALPTLLSIPSALANGLPRLQQADCDACRLTVPWALAHGLPRLQLTPRRLSPDRPVGACQWVAALAAGVPRRLSLAEGYRRRSTPILKKVAYSIKLPLLY